MLSFDKLKHKKQEETDMDKIIAQGGNIVGLAGVLLTAVAGGARVLGHFYLGGFESMTVFLGGMGVMLIGCVAMLHGLSRQRG